MAARDLNGSGPVRTTVVLVCQKEVPVGVDCLVSADFSLLQLHPRLLETSYSHYLDYGGEFTFEVQ